MALLGEPRGGGLKDTAAATNAGLTAADATRCRETLRPGTSALSLMVPTEHARDMNSAMQQAQATQVMMAVLQPGR